MKYLLLLLTALSLSAQQFTSRFPASAPVVGFQFTAGYTNLQWGSKTWPPESAVVYGGVPYIIGQNGRVTVITNTASTNRVVFLDNLAKAFYQSDSGMPSMVFHPDGRRVYTFSAEVRYSTNGSLITTNIVDVLQKWTIDPENRFRVLPESEVLIEQPDRSPQHLGGGMAWDSQTNLLVALADEGQQDGALGNAQKIDRNFFSGVIRIDVDGKPGSIPPNPHPAIRGNYWVPSDNPWIGATSFNGQPVDPSQVRTEFYAVGLRNPHTMVKDPVTGRIFIGDVGNHRWESIFELSAGANFGWNWMEGNEVTSFTYAPPITNRPPVQFTAPIWSYPHPVVADQLGVDSKYQGTCVILGMVYYGAKYPTLNGKLIAGDYSGNVWAITTSQPAVVEWIARNPKPCNGWFVDPYSGDIMAMSIFNASIDRMVPAVVSQPLPQTLSATGVFTDVPSRAVAAGVLPYEVASPFWSDGAQKDRWFWIPPGTQITRDSSDSWAFPTGTFWMKHFTIDGSIETRFLVKTDSGSYGLTYKWRPDGLDADLVGPSGDGITLASGQPWKYPGWSDCLQCHNGSQGALGFSTRQLNTTIGVADGTTVNQLEEFSARGLITPPILSAISLPVLSKPSDQSFPLGHRFKSYVDANCSQCHYPGGPGRGDWDARFGVPLEASGIINGPVTTDLGYTGGVVIAPGDLSKSILFHRIADWTTSGPPDYHMPPLATFVPNLAAIQMVSNYVASIAPRTQWKVGVLGPQLNPYQEFCIGNRINDTPPGSPVAADDDFYTAGTYPAGFNALAAPLTVEADEPAINWERSLTHVDRTNRLHFVTEAGPANLFISLDGGARMSNNIAKSDCTHIIDINLRTPSGVTKLTTVSVLTRITATIPFQAVDGAQTIEFVRVGPTEKGWSYWMNFDYIQISK